MRILRLTAVFLILFMCEVWAAEIDKVDYSRDTNIACVSGTADGEQVTLRVRKNGAVYYEMQTEAGNNKFEFSFPLKGEAATYLIEVGEQENITPKRSSLEFFGEGAFDGLLDDINDAIAANDAVALKSLIEVNAVKLGLSAEVSSYGSELYTALCKAGACGGFDELRNNIEIADMLARLNACQTQTEVESIILEQAERLSGKYPTVYETYLKNKDVCKVLCEKQFTSEENFYDTFVFETIAYSINNANGWATARETVISNVGLLNIDTAVADRSERKNEIYIQLINSKFTKLSDISAKFNEIVNSISFKPQGGGMSGGGGGSFSGGGGSGGGGGSFSGGSAAYIKPVEKAEALNVIFSDMAAAKWADLYVTELYEEGIVSGYAGKFRPNNEVLREEFMKMLILSCNIGIAEAETGFDDVVNGSWYEKYVDTAYVKSISKGMGNNVFGIGRKISRQDLVTLAYRAAVAVGVEFETAESSFADNAEISDYAKESVNAFFAAGIVNGNETGRFCPKNTATRAETAKILYLLREKVKSANYVTEGTGGVGIEEN